jgi:8-oxo-dGTP pyrophosphatase MutT (NUDIX family)
MSTKKQDWKIINTERSIDLKLFKAHFTHFQNPRNQKVERMIILEGGHSANVVAVTPEKNLLFVRQFRVGIQEETLELPGGIIDPGESADKAVRRELEEETGYQAREWVTLGKVASNPVFMDGYIHHFAALDITPTGTLRLDDGEAIVPEILSIADTKKMLKEGLFQHPHTISALVLFFSKLGDRFPDTGPLID